MAENLRRSIKIMLDNSGIRMREVDYDINRGSRRHNTHGIIDILGQLWAYVVKPILDGLGYLVGGTYTYLLLN